MESAFFPQVVPIYWGARFTSRPDEVEAFDEFLRALFASSWMRELAEQGVEPATLSPSFVVAPKSPRALQPKDLEASIGEWLKAGIIAPPRGARGKTPVYLVLAPISAGRKAHAPGFCYASVPLRPKSDDLLAEHALSITRELARVLVRQAELCLGPVRAAKLRVRAAS